MFDPKDSKGFLGTKLKTLARKKRAQNAFVEQVNAQSNLKQVNKHQISVDDSGTIDDVNWLESAHYIEYVDEIRVRHNKTFHIRQSMIKAGKSVQIPIQFPRFFDVDDLVRFSIEFFFLFSKIIKWAL